MSKNNLNRAIDRIATHVSEFGDSLIALSSKIRRHPIATSMGSIAMIGIMAFTIASYSAPTTAPASKAFDFDITVPLVYDGKNVGSTLIPKGYLVEVIAETATTITIRHMGNVLTVNKPGAVATPTTVTTPKVTARPVNPVGASTKPDPEIARFEAMSQRPLPYSVICFEIESDGSYVETGGTCESAVGKNGKIVPARYSFERIGTKLRVLQNGRIWETDDNASFENLIKTDPKLNEWIARDETRRRQGVTKGHRVFISGNSIYSVPSSTPLDKALGFMANRDPRMQSLVNSADNFISGVSWKDAPANCEQVGMETIAKELLADPKSLTPAPVSMRDEVEKLGVKHLRQPDNRSCTVYSSYHLLSFYMKKGDIRPFTLDQFKAMNPRWNSTHTITDNDLLQILAKMEPGLKIRVRELPRLGYKQTSYDRYACDKIYRAFLQHELAAGRPVWIGVSNHKVMLVGYEPNAKAYKRLDGYGIYEGGQCLTALDSTGFGDKDNNYSPWNIDDASTAMTLEFIKPTAEMK